jgi:phospholipase C
MGSANRYAYEVHGPNGFVRRLRGKSEERFIDVSIEYDVKATSLRVRLSNAGDGIAQITIVDNAYGATARKLSLGAGSTSIETWPLERSSRWYDISVTSAADAEFLRRLAGYMENGEPGVSDPAATEPVTTLR